MRGVALLAALAWPSLAAISNFRVLGTTATQALIAYTAPDANACTIQLSQSAGLTPLALDVDPGTFANSNLDLSRPSTVFVGLSRTALLGQRTAQLASAGAHAPTGAPGADNYVPGRHFSRALEANTTYYGAVTCDSIPYTFQLTTSNIPLGGTYGDPWLADRSTIGTTLAGEPPWPEFIGDTSVQTMNDPYTGAFLQLLSPRATGPGLQSWSSIPFGSAMNQGQTTACDTAGPWANPCGLVTGGSGSVTVGNSTAPLILRPSFANANPWSNTSSYNGNYAMDQFSVSFTGSINSTTHPVIDACLSMNGGASCASTVQQFTLGTSSSTQTVGSASTSSYGTTSWLLDTVPRFNLQESSPHYGTGTVSGSTLTWASSSHDYFSLYWVTGGNGHIRISTISTTDACAAPPASTSSLEYSIGSMPDGQHIVVTGTPPAGSVYWCADNFAIMVWRDVADSATVTLTGATMAAVESNPPGNTDDGSGNACYNTAISGGWYCIYGGMEWINPSTTPATTAYFGDVQVNAWNVSNPFGGISAPGGQSGDIDQTQSALTFYMVGIGLSGHNGVLVIQAVYSPSSISQPVLPQLGGQMIQNATCASSTYTYTCNNGLTLTNLTPQVTASESLFQQVAAFNPTWWAAHGSQFTNPGCYAGGVMQGIFYIGCTSIGQDTPGVVIAFSPGDGNPAHAGQSGGPRVIGLVDTIDTPSGTVSAGQYAMTGRSLHGLAEAGDSGWMRIGLNEYMPINTTATAIPASGSRAACSSFGLSISGTCFSLQINSHTSGGSTGYEPYLVSKPAPFTGAPGELRTTQIGDTVCFTTSSSSCEFFNGNELGLLQIKNYNGTQGLWVFSGQFWGTSAVALSGTIYLWWKTVQQSITPGAEGSGQTTYWNPLTGCSGSPDPYGNCLLEDTNETGAHGEWGPGGDSMFLQTPSWEAATGTPERLYGWRSAYQTIVGSPPGIFEYSQANGIPGAVSGVNYVMQNPGFAGKIGHCEASTGECGSHSNPAGALASSNEIVRAFDNDPAVGGFDLPAFTLVTGQLYVATFATVIDADDWWASGSLTALNRKLMATAASAGSHPLIDVSGPGSSIGSTAAQSYTYCVVRVAGECYSGSTVGQVYVNAPGVVWTNCAGNATHGSSPMGPQNDICIGNQSIAANAIRQFSLTANDEAGALTRTLVTATGRLGMFYGFENNRLLPDNSWLIFSQQWANFNGHAMWMAKMPPYPAADSVNRGAFVPFPIEARPPAGLAVNNAAVRFGYQEYGAPGSLNCTTRNDACLATGSTIPAGNAPFYFASENPSGLACASGCAIVVPAISQRVLYYQVVYRDANNVVLATSEMMAAVVP
jgi:hypothetical protein